jgi:hypothetical protein
MELAGDILVFAFAAIGAMLSFGWWMGYIEIRRAR